MDLLANREHSRLELRQKLIARSFSEAIIDQVLQELTQDNLLSEERFAEMLVRTRANRGYGPVRIRFELREKGVPEETIDLFIQDTDESWVAIAKIVREKKFGKIPPDEFTAKQKQSRFLQQRGFTQTQIKRAIQQEE